jgi:hypothetical protein
MAPTGNAIGAFEDELFTFSKTDGWWNVANGAKAPNDASAATVGVELLFR